MAVGSSSVSSLNRKIGAFTGEEQLFVLLDLLKDPKKFEAKMAQLTQLRDEANARIALVGQANEIPRMHEAAQRKAEQAEAGLEAAQTQAELMLKEAEKRARQITADLDAAMKEFEQQRDKALAEIGSKEALIVNEKQTAEQLVAEAGKLRDKAREDADAAAAKRKRYEEAVKRLEASGFLLQEIG